jgi:hypothetical protein
MADPATRTATPTRPPTTPITPEPTLTPLFRATEIFSGKDGQELTLFVGDVFVLHRSADDEGPLTIDNPDVLQAMNDAAADVVTLKAIGLGEAEVSWLQIIPCPPAGQGMCEPPWWHFYVYVYVVEP